MKRPSAGVMSELMESIGRIVAQAMIDVGEVIMVKIGASGDTVDIDDDKADAWAHGESILHGHRYHGRIYNPGGIVFRKPQEGETAHVIRAREHSGPGDCLFIPDGGDGSKDHLPSWYGDDDAGVSCDKETAHLESRQADVKIEANASGKKVQLNAGTTVEVNGADYSLLKTEDLLSDLKNYVDAVNATIGSNCINGAPLSAYAANALPLLAFGVQLSTNVYKSTKAKNG